MQEKVEIFELSVIADIISIIGFIITLVLLIVTIIVKSEVTKLKMNYMFDQRINSHLKKLVNITSNLNTLLNNYENNESEIKIKLRESIAELQDVKTKLGFWDSLKSRRLIYLIKRRLTKPFDLKGKKNKRPFMVFILKYPSRLYKTTKDDIYLIHEKLHEVRSQIQNLRENRKKSL